MRNSVIENFEKRFNPQERQHPSFRPGDTIRVHYKIEEASKGSKDEKKYRLQAFEGVCLKFKKGAAQSSFSVRKIGANSVGVERIFNFNSPMIDSIEIVSGGKVRRARLYYLRDLSGKAARIRSRRLPSDAILATVDPTKEKIVKKKKDKKAAKKAKAKK